VLNANNDDDSHRCEICIVPYAKLQECSYWYCREVTLVFRFAVIEFNISATVQLEEVLSL